jgi:hypothetical protein
MLTTNQPKPFDEGYYNTCCLAGLWSTQAKVESIVLKAVWHWGSDSSVTNDGLLSTWGCVNGVIVCFPPISWDGSLTGDTEI